MDNDTLILVVIALAALAGAFFTVVPILPGALFIPAGAVVIGLAVGWDEIPLWFWFVQALLVAAYLLVDNVAQVIGVKRVGGSRSAMVGGAVGVFVGPIVLALALGPFALLIGPPVGAVAGTLIGEEHARRKLDPATAAPRDVRALSVGALIAYAVSTAIKLLLVGMLVALLFAVTR